MVDTELLQLSQFVLEDAGYRVFQTVSDGYPHLLAEDQDNIVALGTVLRVEDLFIVEPLISQTFGVRLSTNSMTSKKWDCYAIILSGTKAEPGLTEALFELAYDLSQVRKIVRVGVEATTAAVTRSLSAVLPLPEIKNLSVLSTGPLEALISRLVADGLSPDQTQDALQSFQSQSGTPISDTESYSDRPEEFDDDTGGRSDD